MLSVRYFQAALLQSLHNTEHGTEQTNLWAAPEIVKSFVFATPELLSRAQCWPSQADHALLAPS